MGDDVCRLTLHKFTRATGGRNALPCHRIRGVAIYFIPTLIACDIAQSAIRWLINPPISPSIGRIS